MFPAGILGVMTVSFAVYPLHTLHTPCEMSSPRHAEVHLAMDPMPSRDLPAWMRQIEAPKLSVHADGCGKGGVYAAESIAPNEVIAQIPRTLVLQCTSAIKSERALEFGGWAAKLTAAALTALHAEDDTPMKSWIKGWQSGGWASDTADLGPPGIRYGSDDVTGSLMATGSDNDDQVFSVFKFPCHPVVYRASLGLASLTRSDEQAALAALITRGTAYRAMRDELLPLVKSPSKRAKGSTRDKKSWDVADMLSCVLSRANSLVLDDESGEASAVVVPLYDQLEHCTECVVENVRLELGWSVGGKEAVLLVASREIAAGEALTRDYSAAPPLPGDTSEGALQLLLQFGIRPSAWEPDAQWALADESLAGPAEGRREVAW